MSSLIEEERQVAEAALNALDQKLMRQLIPRFVSKFEKTIFYK